MSMSDPSEQGVPAGILTVCIGNMCRSPLAERLLRLHLADAVATGVVRVDSAGVRPVVGHAMEENAAAELVRLGGDPTGFAARRVEPDLVLEATLVLAMTREIRADVLREQPRAMRRTFTLPEFAEICRGLAREGVVASSVAELVATAARRRALAAEIDQDIPDPIGRPAAVHREVADRIAADIDAVVAALHASTQV
ncbi:MAG: low molecular weight phosphatase family protein [Actinobacteria bacterium]|uniref:protein-tyrosine-phosphatase n=1 Tax=freshwater metagenome TaxID=449393 RepID=A0A6J6P9F4_9ZZZZ|nr:low molecular weight phosphatase family protein [Actinomycetota bacterium]